MVENVNNIEVHMNDEMRDGRALDVFKIADLLVSRAVATHGEEIDLIAYYGSYAQGTAGADSDLDIFYVPADGKNPPVGRTFLVAGRLFDFWAIGWDTLAGFATGRARGWSFAPAIVHHAKLLYARSAEQAARFAALQQQVLDLQKPQARSEMIQRALDKFPAVLAHLGNLRLAIAADDLADARHAGWQMILAVWECLALANQTFGDQGWGHMLEAIPRLQARPDDLEALLVIVGTAVNPTVIANAAEKLALETRQVLRALQNSLTASQAVHEQFANGYPEIKDGLRKIVVACERQRPFAANVAAWFIQYELSLMLNALQNSADYSNFNLYSEFAARYRQLGFPDLMQASGGDLATLAAQARLLDDRLRQWLGAEAVDLCEYETFADFARQS